MSKRNLARIISFLAAGVLAVSLFTIGAVVKAVHFERQAEAMYQKNLAAANEYLADMDTVLVKGLYSASAADQSAMCADLWRDAYEAKNAISALPVADLDMEACYSYLSKVAEYARATEKNIANGQTISDSAYGTFLSIKRKSASLAASFEKLQNIYLGTGEKIGGGIDFSFAAPRTIATSHATSEGLNALNKNMSNAPKLIYDGPYSDAVNEKTPLMLKGKSEIALKTATQTAERFLKNENGVLEYSGTKKGNLSCYCFRKGNCYLEISRRGGKIVSFNSDDAPAKTAFDKESCLKLAQIYLEKAGYQNMKCDYYENANHTLIANFHSMDGAVNCYTDLIKVKVNCESGKISGFDAVNYLTNHQQRTLRAKLSATQAQSAVSSRLKIKDVKQALIPTADEKEVLCYEFRCLSADGEELLVFIDANTGSQKDILILQIGENSVLTK